MCVYMRRSQILYIQIFASGVLHYKVFKYLGGLTRVVRRVLFT